LGTINHAILEETYREIGSRGLSIAAENQEEAITILQAVADRVLREAPAQYNFAIDALWEQEQAVLRRRLTSLLRLDFSAEGPITKKLLSGPRHVYLLEAPFHRDGGAEVLIPLRVEGREENLRVTGYIDRIDQVGDQALVIDYKTGSTKIPLADMREGRNFQMMVYLYAADQILHAQGDAEGPQSVAGGLFWHIRTQEASGEIRLDDDDHLEALNQARDHLGRYLAAGRRGDFSVQPRKIDQGRCVHYCEFAQLCRAASTHPHKTEMEL
jgi:ATP-dependent helicase/DNAse subunit B